MTQALYEVFDLQRDVEIGCAPEEHGVRQPVAITMRATLDHRHLFAGDTMTPPYDYCEMLTAVDDAIASRPRFILQETLFVAIAARVLANPVVLALEMELAKTARYPGTRAIGVRARLTREDLAAMASRFADDPAVASLAASASSR